MLTDSQDLPSDIAALRALILAERAERRAEQAAQTTELVAKQIEIEHLRAMLAKLRRQRYGRSSEKLDAELDQLELTLEDAEVGQAQAEAKVAEAAGPTGEGTSRRPRRPAVRKPLPDHLPREIVVLEPKLTCRCNDPSCRTKIREEVTEVLEKVPSQLKVIRYIRPIRVGGRRPTVSSRTSRSACRYPSFIKTLISSTSRSISSCNVPL